MKLNLSQLTSFSCMSFLSFGGRCNHVPCDLIDNHWHPVPSTVHTVKAGVTQLYGSPEGTLLK